MVAFDKTACAKVNCLMKSIQRVDLYLVDLDLEDLYRYTDYEE